MPPAVTGTSVLERFLRYVTYDTQSDMKSDSFPSSAKQLVLLEQLVKELQAMGIQDAARDEYGYVFGTVPATTKKANVPVVGFIAHVDTSPEASGENVKPIVHTDWNGEDIRYPDDPNLRLRPSELPMLKSRIGYDIVTASGKTLLGADDKAGVAEIMAAAEFLVQHPEIPHGAIRVGFTPDEEIGGGTRFFDVKKFGAAWAYTMDGETCGVLDSETFSADSMEVRFQGFVTHPGMAKGKMVNSIRIAGDFLAKLPKDRLSPETTEGREGFVHPVDMDAAVDRTSVRFIIRDFSTPGLKEKEAMLEKLAREACAAWPGSSVTFEVQESYRNLREILDRNPQTIECAREAFRRSGLDPVDGAIRGGTDGSRLSFMGLPTPNIFAGGHQFHSRLEWVAVEDMEKAVEVIVNLAQVVEERA